MNRIRRSTMRATNKLESIKGLRRILILQQTGRLWFVILMKRSLSDCGGGILFSRCSFQRPFIMSYHGIRRRQKGKSNYKCVNEKSFDADGEEIEKMDVTLPAERKLIMLPESKTLPGEFGGWYRDNVTGGEHYTRHVLQLKETGRNAG